MITASKQLIYKSCLYKRKASGMKSTNILLFLLFHAYDAATSLMTFERNCSILPSFNRELRWRPKIWASSWFSAPCTLQSHPEKTNYTCSSVFHLNSAATVAPELTIKMSGVIPHDTSLLFNSSMQRMRKIEKKMCSQSVKLKVEDYYACQVEP